MHEGPKEWERRPNGCPDDEHWKECYRNGLIAGPHCNHPSDTVDNRDGMPICPHKPNAVTRKTYNQRSEK
jgi:hypothetical protein